MLVHLAAVSRNHILLAFAELLQFQAESQIHNEPESLPCPVRFSSL